MTTQRRHPWHFLRRFLLTIAPLIALAGQTAHAGLLAEATRIIYPAGAPARTLTLTNTNAWPVVVQIWFDHGEGDPEALAAPPFIAIPAIFRLAPGSVQTLRIVATGEALPETRESVYWLNLYEIPPAAPQADTPSNPDADTARLDLALNTQLKLFYRPQGLPQPENLTEDLAAQLHFQLEAQNGQWFIACHNPTAWHASFAGLAISGIDGQAGELQAQQEPDMMTPPQTTRRYRLAPGTPLPDATVEFSLIDDGGFGREYVGTPRQNR